jgi:hypothetical protein
VSLLRKVGDNAQKSSARTALRPARILKLSSKLRP